MQPYDPHEMKSVRRGVNPKKVIAAYKHFGSFRKAGETCGIHKDTAKAILKRYAPDLDIETTLPPKASYNVKNAYSKFAKWHKANAGNSELTHSIKEMAKLAEVSSDAVKCYFYRRRKSAAKLLRTLPDLRKLCVILEDIEGNEIDTRSFAKYKFVIDRYSEKAALRGKPRDIESEVTIVIPSIEVFVKRIAAISKPE